jgi:hypothetical protein
MAQIFNTCRDAFRSMAAFSTESRTMSDPLPPTSVATHATARARVTASSALLRTLGVRLRAWWRAFCMDEETLFLSQATTLSELEQRQRQWDRHCVHGAWQRRLY